MRRRGNLVLAVVALAVAVLLARSCGDDQPTEPAAPTNPQAVVQQQTPESPASPDENVAPSEPRPERKRPTAEKVTPTTGVVFGRVRHPSGISTENAAVRLTPDGDEERAVVIRCDADGAYRTEGLAPGRWRVTVAGGGFATRLDVPGAEPTFVELNVGDELEVDLTVTQLAVVAGTVTDADGRLIEGAKVRIQCAAFLYAHSSVWHLEATTGEDGRFERTSVTPGDTLRVLVDAPGEPHWSQWLRDVDPGERVDLDIRLERSARFELLLRDAETGKPIPKVLVWIKDAETRDSVTEDGIYSDDDGRVVVSVPAGRSIDLQMGADDYVRVQTRTVSAASVLAGPVTIELDSALTISGSVLLADATPAAFVDVIAFDPRHTGHLPPGFGGGTEEARTDEEGRFRITGLTAGAYRIGVVGDDWRPVAAVDANAGDSGVVLELGKDDDPQRHLTYRVTGPRGASIEQVRLRDGVHFDGVLGSHAGGVLTSPDGSVTSVTRAHGALFLEAWDARGPGDERLPFGHLWIEVPEDPPRPWVVAMPPERAIEGRVTGAEGRPLGAATIYVFSVIRGRSFAELDDVHTESDGTFRIRGLGPSEYLLKGVADGHLATSVTSRGGEKGVEISLGVGKSIAVRVLDPDGVPIRGARVRALPSDRTEEQDEEAWDEEPTQTGADGYARLPALAANLPHDLFVGVMQRDGEEGFFPHELERWAPIDYEVRLQRALDIEGTVRTPDGRAVAGCRLVADDQEGNELHPRPGATPGSFELTRLHEGVTVRLVAACGAAQSAETLILAGRRDAVVEIDLGAWFAVRLDDRSARRERNADRWGRNPVPVHAYPGQTSAGLQPGRGVTLGGLEAAERYTVLVGPSATGRFAEIAGVAADGRTVTVTLEDGTPLTGTVRTSGGGSAAGRPLRVQAVLRGVVVGDTDLGSDGSFRFPGLPPGVSELRVVDQDSGALLGSAEATDGVAIEIRAR